MINLTERDPDKFEYQPPNRHGQPAYYVRAVAERNDAEKKYFIACDNAAPEELARQLSHLQELDQRVDEAWSRWQEELKNAS